MELERCWGVAEDGAAVEVALRPALVEELERRWPPIGLERRFEPHEPLEARFGLSDEWLIVPDVEPSSDSPPPVAWDLLESELALFAVKRLIRLVPVHSAVIVWNGSVLMVPATSGAGKSTLALAAAGAGATVLSDEYALIDPATGQVTGWPRPVRRRLDDGTVERVDVAVPSPPLPVGLVAAVTHDPSAGDAPVWRALTPAEAAVELLNHTICSRSRPDDALDAVLKVGRSAPAVGGARGDARAAIGELLRLLDDSADRPAPAR